MTMSSCGEVICLNFDKLFASDFSAHNFVIYKDYMSCAVLRLSFASVHHILSLLYPQSFHSTKRFSRSLAVQFIVGVTRTKLASAQLTDKNHFFLQKYNHNWSTCFLLLLIKPPANRWRSGWRCERARRSCAQWMPRSVSRSHLIADLILNLQLNNSVWAAGSPPRFPL